MENCPNEGRPKWPLYAGSLTAQDLAVFQPLNYSVLAGAFDLGLIDVQTLANGFRTPGFAVVEPSEMLAIFLKTSSYIDRRRDIQEELQNLSRFDDKRRQELWVILAQLILKRYPDADEAVRVLEEVAQELGMPPTMQPFTLYGYDDRANPHTSQSSSAILDSLRSFLESRYRLGSSNSERTKRSR